MSQRIFLTLVVVFFASSIGLAGFALAGDTIVVDGGRELSDDNAGVVRVRADAGLIRTGSGNWGTLSNTNKYGVLIVGHGNAGRAGTKPGRALTWGCGVNIPNATWSAGCGVSWADAVANNWLLKDGNGNYVPYGDGYSYLADVGNVSFQRRWISDMDADIRTHPGVDGVFIDNIVGHLIRRSTKYSDSASYRAAMLSFVRTVGKALQAKGWYVAANLSMSDGSCSTCGGQSYDGSQWIWWAGQVASSVDGIALERWQQNWDSARSVRVIGSTGSTAWQGWQRVPGAVHSLGKDFYAIESGALTDVDKARYLRASYLLGWKFGRGAFLYSDNYDGKGDPWTLVARPDIGRPAGVPRRVGVGFRRIFTSGAVVVNPDPSDFQTFGFQRKYLMPDGRTTSSLTLPPGSGLVLRRASVRR
jgi:hypothetical protein